jgi:hypothetical protein
VQCNAAEQAEWVQRDAAEQAEREQQQLAAVMAAISTQSDANLAPIKSSITTLMAKVQLVEDSLGCQDARCTGYGDKNDGVVSSLCADVNKNSARIINV